MRAPPLLLVVVSMLWCQGGARAAASSAAARHRVQSACTSRQRAAEDVLAHVASGQQQQTPGRLQRRRQLGDDGTPNIGRFVHPLAAPAPPKAWWQLMAAIESDGLAGLKAALAPGKATLPDVQGAAAAHCSLARHAWAHTFGDPALAGFVAALFLATVRGRAAAAAQLRAPPPLLTRFDLWHGHVFVAHDCQPTGGGTSSNSSAGGAARNQHQQQAHASSAPGVGSAGLPNVGILLHAAEFPAFDAARFPITLGFCQKNSSLRFNQKAMDLRNILWFKGRLAVLDVGAASPLNKLLLHEGTEPLRTLYEEDFGRPVGDLLLLQQPRPRRRRSLAADQARRLQALDASGPAALARELADMQQAVFVSY